MYVLIPFKIGSSQAHLINLVRNDKDAAPGTYEFTLKHNAFGEVASSGEGQYTLGGTYMSFPVVGLFEGDEADIIIHWNSGEDAGDDADAEGKRNSLVYKWKSGGFEQDMNP